MLLPAQLLYVLYLELRISSRTRNILYGGISLLFSKTRYSFFFCFFFFSFVFVEVLRPKQQLRSCRAGQLPVNTVPGQA